MRENRENKKTNGIADRDTQRGRGCKPSSWQENTSLSSYSACFLVFKTRPFLASCIRNRESCAKTFRLHTERDSEREGNKTKGEKQVLARLSVKRTLGKEGYGGGGCNRMKG